MQVKKLLLFLIALLPLMAVAQFDMGENIQAKPAWQEFKLSPTKTVKLNFRNASADLVLDFLSRVSGITILKDPSLVDKLTVSTPKAVKLNEAFTVVNAALTLRGYEMKKQGNLILVSKKSAAVRAPRVDMTGMATSNRTELKVYKIQYANAAAVARVVNEVFSGQTATSRFGGRRFGGPGMMMGGPFDPNAAAQGQPQEPVARASSDDYSNTVIVNATRDTQRQVEELIKELDQQTEQPTQPRVYPLKYADADDLASVVQNVLTQAAPTGRGGQGTQNVPFEQRFGMAMRFGSMQSAFGTVVADTRTNSLVVSATEANHAMIAKVIADLDVDTPIQDTTFVFPLKNARADLIADLLTQTFGSRSSTGYRGTSGYGSSSSRQYNTGGSNRRTSSGGGGNLGRTGAGNRAATDRGIDDRAAIDRSADELPIDFEDPARNVGDLLTSVSVGQFFQMGGQRRRTGSSSTTNDTYTTGRDTSGRLVNVRNMENQVTVIADTNTNSVIVVTDPGNVDMVKSILAQLDRIPEQVMIETMIVEATLDESTKLGVEWSLATSNMLGNTGVTGTGTTDFGMQAANADKSGFRYTITGGNLNAFVNILKQDQRYHVLSTPRIFTSNNTQAQINISQSVPYVVSQREDASGNLTFNYSFQDVGIVLTVTPRISANGVVTLDVDQTANDLQGYTTFNAPIVNQRQASTTVSVKDGETVILGGIIRNTVSSTVKKLPLLGDIPVLGNLFRSTSKEKVKTELLVFLTPHVVRNDDDARALRTSTEGQLSDATRKQVQEQLKKSDDLKTDDKKTDGEVKK